VLALETGNRAVTQNNDVFVAPNYYADFVTPGNIGRYEEIFHTRQFAVLGSVLFYATYGSSSTVATASGHDPYWSNELEKTAKEAAKHLANMFARERPCI
jgi:hypothetical protein